MVTRAVRVLFVYAFCFDSVWSLSLPMSDRNRRIKDLCLVYFRFFFLSWTKNNNSNNNNRMNKCSISAYILDSFFSFFIDFFSSLFSLSLSRFVCCCQLFFINSTYHISIYCGCIILLLSITAWNREKIAMLNSWCLVSNSPPSLTLFSKKNICVSENFFVTAYSTHIFFYKMLSFVWKKRKYKAEHTFPFYSRR